MVLAPVWAIQYIKYPPYLRRRKVSMETRRLTQIKPSVGFRPAAVRSREAFRKQPSLQVVALEYSKVGERVLVDYIVGHRFEQSSRRDLHKNEVN